MSVLRFVATVAMAGALSVAAQASLGQSPGPVRVEPFYPTFSPWLRLYQHNPGPLDNYNSYVRPELQLRERIQRINAISAHQAAGMSDLQGQLEGLHNDAAVRPTGTGSVFMNYSHYYDSRKSQARFGR